MYSDITRHTTKQFPLKTHINNNKEIIENIVKHLKSDTERYKASVANSIDFDNRVIDRQIERTSNYTIHEQNTRKILLDNLIKYKTIAIQQGSNLDINASIYAIKNFMLINHIIDNEDELKVVRLPAGKTISQAVNIDNGKLKGILISDNDNQISINANENLGERSACAILAKLGIYVPSSIVANADKIYDEKILNPRYGLVLARNLDGKMLFKFAEEIRDETSLLELNLSDEELENYGLIEQYKTQKENLENGSAIIDSYTYEVNESKIAIVPNFVTYGSYSIQ